MMVFDNHDPPETTPYEPLTEREADILALLAEGLSDREIAERLVVAYTTVKWYNRQIFNKLGVDNRRAAIERARTLGLVSGGEPPPAPVRNNLPAQTTSFVGRKRELDEIGRLLDNPQVRLITILAPGGMGKTRLALAAAEMLVSAGSDSGVQSLVQDGVFFVPLAALASPTDMLPAIADGVDYRFQPDSRTPRQQVLDYLSDKHLLLVLDNFEHLLNGATLVSEILQAAPAVQILATSRERLNLSGETVYTLGGMAYPDQPLDDTPDHSAVQLFVQCARRIRPDFTANGENQHIIRVCQLVQGMPLALELAAAWVEVLSPGEIADEIGQSLDFLQSEMRDVPERQRSVRTVFESSWQRLADTEQQAFRRLAVFRGGCTREAAQTVTGADLRTLLRLVDKALVWRTPVGRFALHELLRQYGVEHLETAGETHVIQDAHSAYYARFAQEREADLKGRRQLDGLLDLETDFENVRAAWNWAVERRNLHVIDRMAECLYWFGAMRYRQEDTEPLFASALARFVPPPNEAPHPVWGKVLARARRVRDPQAWAQIEQALDIARQLDDRGETAFGLYRLSEVMLRADDYRACMEIGQQSVTAFRELGDSFYLSRALNIIGGNFIYLGQPARTPEYVREAIAISRSIGDQLGLANALWNLGGALSTLDVADPESITAFEEAYRVFREMGDRMGAANILGWHLAGVDLSQGNLERARARTRELEAVAVEYHMDHSRGRALIIRGFAALFEEDYTHAQELGEISLPLIGPQHSIAGMSRLLISAAAITQGKYDFATSYLRWLFQFALENWPFNFIYEELVVAAYILAQRGKPERAVELLALVVKAAPSALGNRMYPRWRAGLPAELTPEVYQAAWERGQTLDMETVCKQLLAEFMD